MQIELNHTIIPAADRVIASRFYKRIFGFKSGGDIKDCLAVKVNDTLTLHFKDSDEYINNHYAFRVDNEFFDLIYSNILKEGLHYGSDVYDLENMELNHWHGGRGLYFRDPNGHTLELLTQIPQD